MNNFGVIDVTGKSPPHDLDAEGAVISASMYDHMCMSSFGYLQPEHFYSESHRRIYEAIVAVKSKLEDSQIPCIVLVGAWLKNHNRIEQVGGLKYLKQILTDIVAPVNAGSYARIVYDKWRVREFIQSCARLAATGYGEYGETQDLLDAGAAEIVKISQTSDQNRRERNLDALKRVMAGIVKAGTLGTHVTGLSTGFADYDNMTAGLHGTELTVIGAATGMGKSSFAIQLAINVARQGVSVLIFSIEMHRDEIFQRAIATLSSIDLLDLRAGKYSNKEAGRIPGVLLELNKLPIFIEDSPELTSAQIQSITNQWLHDLPKEGQPPLGLVIVDYAQKIADPINGGRKSREEIVSNNVWEMKVIAKKTRLPVVLFAQLNRESERGSKKGDKIRRPQTSDLRESAGLAMHANNIVFIHRDDYHKWKNYNGDGQYMGNNEAELIVAKQRNGPCGIVKVGFEGKFTRFFDPKADPFEGKAMPY